ncbi:hypothetical protein [Halobacterium sp. CBA1126]|uniref:hypothetical protein n=1 Tax=Halobacterium sp. CBA1126 TaxID=2668074 RepID=UPI0012F90628|nr:hypothetical protein [Halobacterium sp. CBA1126]MUV60167.1 hypothetical protein [Halobacterium sp. CBA1126]
MRFRDDSRAQSVQIGAILLFATLIIALSVYQATVVPSQNADVEYKHSQTVQNQLTDVRNGILRSAATGTTQPVSVTLGTQYPSRVFLMNPPPATGTLRTGSYENNGIEVSNVVATNDETRDFLDGSWTASTKYLEYEPNYHEYDNAPNLAYGETLLYNRYPREGTTIPLSDQLLVDGNTITLVALNGSVGTTQSGSVSVNPQALSGPYERVQVTNESDEPVELTIPTQLSADTLTNRTGLGGQDAFQNAEAVGDDRVRVTLDPGTYTLRTAKVGVGSGTDDPGPRYLTTSDDRTVQNGEEFTVSMRDAFNNPVSGDVNVTVNRSVVGPQSKRVSEDGTVTFTYDGPTGPFNASILDGGSEERKVVFEGQPATDGGGGVGGGDDTYDVTLETSNRESEKVVWNVTENGTSIDLISEVTSNAGPVFGTNVDYAVNTSSATLSSSTGVTNASGQHTTTVDVPEEDGWEGTVFAASGDDVDALPIRVEHNPDAAGTFRSKIVDQGQTGSLARYETSYDATGVTDFDRVEVTYENLDSGGADETYTSFEPRDNIDDYGWVDENGGTGGDTYEITIEVYDTNGNVVDSRTVTDDADNVNPGGNDDLSENDSPTLSSSTVTDTSQFSTARYTVDYDVSDSAGKFTETEVLFLNEDSAYATDQQSVTETTGTAFHSAGGAEDDQYQILIQVLDDDGIVVNQRLVSDVADGSIDGSSSTATQTQISNFGKTPGQDRFSAQVQSQDSDGDTDMDRIEYVITDSDGNVVATATRTGSGQQIQPGTITIQSDQNIQGGETYTLFAVGYDQDGNYDWETANA